jgi:hypothetical protein
MDERIAEDQLAERWFAFLHGLIRLLQGAFRQVGRNGITQKLIARRLGKSPAFISRCLSGQQNMTIRTMHDLAFAMGYRLEISLQPLASLPAANWHSSAAEARQPITPKASVQVSGVSSAGTSATPVIAYG